MTQLKMAHAGNMTSELKTIAKNEGLHADFIRRGLAKGRIVIPKNKRRYVAKPCGIGERLRTKIIPRSRQNRPIVVTSRICPEKV